MLTINCVWASGTPSATEIRRLLATLRCAVELGEVFTIPDDGSGDKATAVKEEVPRGFLRQLSFEKTLKAFSA